MSFKRLCAAALAAGLCLAALPPLAPASAAEPFDDVPASSYAWQDILDLREMGITEGIGNNLYGINQTLKRAEFVVLLSRLLGWETNGAAAADFDDLPDPLYGYATAHIAAAVEHGAIEAGGRFRPGDDITREEIACMLVGALGYGTLASQSAVTGVASPFTDVSLSSRAGTYGRIILAYDFGIINGIPDGSTYRFDPDASATREQAAAMVMRLYRRVFAKLDEVHTFYHYTGGAQQAALLQGSDSVSFGWAKLEYWNSRNGAYLNTTSQNSNQWHPPGTAASLVEPLARASVPYNLCVFMDRSQRVTLPDGTEARDVDLILPDDAQRQAAVAQIAAQATGQTGGIAYSGVTIDFEGLTLDSYAPQLNSFMRELRAALPSGMDLSIAVPPRDWYKGYDYRTLGAVCDRVILMAHDFASTTMPDYQKKTDLPETPLAPIARVYAALRDLVNPVDGVEDKSKILLAVSFGTLRWEIVDGTVQNSRGKTSGTAAVYNRLVRADTEMLYFDQYQSPCIRYYDDSDGTTNVVWYEDARSIAAKADLAAMFGVNGISLWQAGIVPNYQNPDGRDIFFDVWQALQSRRTAR